MKRGNTLVAALFLAVFSFTLVSAAACNLQTGTSCTSGVKILGLASPTNSHGELASQNNYGYSICCDLSSGTFDCDGTNEILSLSSPTNAHAQEPSQTGYSNNICYTGLSCAYSTTSCGTDLEVVSLSSVTNAHLGEPGAYSGRICCSITSALTTLQWKDTSNNVITSANVSVGTTTVRLYFKNDDIPANTSIRFQVWEEDGILDDFIRNISATTGANGTAFADWTITQSDIDSANAGGVEQTYEFYFKVDVDPNALKGPILAVSLLSTDYCLDNNITFCSDYADDQDNCNIDPCAVGSIGGYGNLSCSDPDVTCYCTFLNGACQKAADTTTEGGINYGTCIVSEEQVDENGCDDGFLTITWNGNWVWNEEQNPEHLDPNGLQVACEDTGTKVIECPAQVQLPFFGFYNIIAVILIIIITYFILSTKKKKKHSAKRKKKH